MALKSGKYYIFFKIKRGDEFSQAGFIGTGADDENLQWDVSFYQQGSCPQENILSLVALDSGNLGDYKVIFSNPEFASHIAPGRFHAGEIDPVVDCHDAGSGRELVFELLVAKIVGNADNAVCSLRRRSVSYERKSLPDVLEAQLAPGKERKVVCDCKPEPGVEQLCEGCKKDCSSPVSVYKLDVVLFYMLDNAVGEPEGVPVAIVLFMDFDFEVGEVLFHVSLPRAEKNGLEAEMGIVGEVRDELL
jgi:hypothetical protein